MDRAQSNKVTMSSLESASASTSPHSTVTCVLGLYGLPGSGKSTLCKCLVDHFRPLYGGKNTLYLEFASTPSDVEVVNKLKELRHLTNFRERVELDRASDLEHVESLLKSCCLSSCKVFLVLDNISDKTCKAVHRILHLGFGPGSKIVLVARTLDVLRKTLDALRHRLQWASGSMAVPSIDETEASEILLRSARGDYGAALDRQSLTSRKMGIVERIVHMCRFRDDGERGHAWLPLVMEAVGARFFNYDKDDFEGWEKDLESLWMRVKTYAQDALIKELLGDNFKALLDEHLQVLFLDVTLCILHMEEEIDRVIDALIMMHSSDEPRIRMLVDESRKRTLMQMQINDLSRRGFLIVSAGRFVGVHDVYLEFARSIQDCPSKYINMTTPISWCWKECLIPDAESGRSLLLEEGHSLEDKGKLRSLVLEVGESCERVDLRGFSGLKAVILRNCKSVAVLGLAGLSSLTILEVRECASFGRVECCDSDDSSLLNIKRLKVQAGSKALAEVDEGRGQVPYLLQPVVNSVKRAWMAAFRQPKSLGAGYKLLSQMRCLQVVHLENTGIGRLECVGGMWPQLRDLTVIEQHLERFELGCLPKLERLLFRDVSRLKYLFSGLQLGGHNLCQVPDRSLEMGRRKEGDVRYLLAGQDLLLGCPQLKQVMMQSSFLKQEGLGNLPAGMQSVELRYLHNAIELPDLSSSAHTLQILDLGSCEKLERVNLDAGFKSLTELRLVLCHNLVEVNGFGSLPSLCVLEVVYCRKLQNLKGFENSKEMEELTLVGVRELKEISCFGSLESLRTLRFSKYCPKSVGSSPKADDMCGTGKLLFSMEKLVECAVCECCFNISSCKSLTNLELFVNRGSLGGELLRLEGLDKLEKMVSVAIMWDLSKEEADYEPSAEAAMCGLASVVRLGGTGSISIDLSSMGNAGDVTEVLASLEIGPGGCVYRLSLNRCVLGNVEGIGQCLATLKGLSLLCLPYLRSLRGVESLTQLESLLLWDCPVLEEVPSLHALVHLSLLEIIFCPKVQAVEGCDNMTQLRSKRINGRKYI